MMTRLKTIAPVIAQKVMRNPEKLWQHYGLALSIFVLVMLATHWVNGVLIERSRIAALEIQYGSTQTERAERILDIAENMDWQSEADVADLNTAISQLEAVHLLIRSLAPLPGAIVGQPYQRGDDLGAVTATFIQLADRLSDAQAGASREILGQMQQVWRSGDLHEAQSSLTSQIAARLHAEANGSAQLQQFFFGAVITVLLAEAIFVFWPAHYAVQVTIGKMRRQTSVLRQSQARLKKLNSQLARTVNYSQLTGLPNRAFLERYLLDVIQKRTAGDLQLYLVGLDDFKSVNDMFGHSCGDELLISVSKALASCVDFDQCIVHVNGDEFVIVSDEDPRVLLRMISNALAGGFNISNRQILTRASIGYLTIGSEVRPPMEIVSDAALALQFAKNSGGGCAQEFTPELRATIGAMQALQIDLKAAIENGEIEPWFQPQVRLCDGKLHGAEVLARWRHPTRGLLTPDVFLPAAGRAGLMIELDHAVWTAAMRLAEEWEDKGIWKPVISLNAAPDTIADPNLIERFLLSLSRSGLTANQVVVEVLETTLINGKDDMAAINIDSLAECGIALELDDFGTGYASLSKLTQLPLAGIKLDRSLIAPLPDKGADSVVRAILALASELGLKVIAEGVEELAQAQHLNDRGCGVVQGYGFGRPMPPQEFTKWLSTNANTNLYAA